MYPAGFIEKRFEPQHTVKQTLNSTDEALKVETTVLFW